MGMVTPLVDSVFMSAAPYALCSVAPSGPASSTSPAVVQCHESVESTSTLPEPSVISIVPWKSLLPMLVTVNTRVYALLPNRPV